MKHFYFKVKSPVWKTKLFLFVATVLIGVIAFILSRTDTPFISPTLADDAPPGPWAEYEETAVAPCEGVRVEKKGWGKEGSNIQNHAWWVSGCDKSFVHMLDQENGQWTKERVSDNHWCASVQKTAHGYGLCQISSCYHPETVADENFLNEKWQLQKCYDMYKEGVRFYGADKGESRNIEFYE